MGSLVELDGGKGVVKGDPEEKQDDGGGEEEEDEGEADVG